VDRKISASAARDLERLETSLEAWSSTSGPEADAKAEELLSDLDGVASKYRGRYAGQKALVLAGRVYGSRKDWASAEKKFLEAADLKKDSILSSFALQEAARSAEERQDLETAIKLWNRVVESSSGLTVGLPTRILSWVTLYEESKQYSEASARYEKLIASYPDNDWTKLARDRIILLKSQGLLP
jgi:tetratricopeptide (TPR) repeat protein